MIPNCSTTFLILINCLLTSYLIWEKVSPGDKYLYYSRQSILRNFSKDDYDLLKQESFVDRLGKKRLQSAADTMTHFLACITKERVTETNRQWGSQFQLQLFDCIHLHVPIEKHEMEIFKAINVEYKLFLPMDKTYYAQKRSKCIWLTIGIGNHTQAEEEFKKLHPKCQLFGTEIIPDNVGNYSDIGTVLNMGVGTERLHVNYSYAGRSYSNLSVKPLGEVLRKHVGSNILHYATIDVEGNEFTILKEFTDFGLFYKEGVVICQLDAELHANIGGDFELGPYMRQFFHNSSSYLPIYAAPYDVTAPHAIKMTFINIKNVDCELAFRFSQYFER